MMPFAGGIEANANATLIFSLAAAIAYAFVLHQPTGRPRSAAKRTAVKTMAVGLLAALTVMQGGPWLLAGALGLSALGDALLSRDGQKAFLGGLASFLAAHIVYGVAFFHLGDGAGVVFAQPWRAALGVVIRADARLARDRAGSAADMAALAAAARVLVMLVMARASRAACSVFESFKPRSPVFSVRKLWRVKCRVKKLTRQ